MINNLWMYAVLPLVPGLICLRLLIKLTNRKSESHYIKLFFNLFLMNISQMLGYIAFSFSPNIAEYIADAYLITLYFFFTHLIITSISISTGQKFLGKINPDWFYVFPLLLTSFHLAGLMVESYRVDHNSLMHNDGVLAWAFDLYILSSSISIIFILFRNAKECSNDRMLFSKNVITIISFIPLVIAFFIIVALSMTQYAIPVVVIGPIITAYTALSFFYISKEHVIDLSMGFSFFWDRLKLAYKLLETHKTKSDLKRYYKALDKQFIKEALNENSHQIQVTADYLNMNHTTLRKKMKEYSL